MLKTMAMSGDGPERETESTVGVLGQEAHDAGVEERTFAAQFTSSARGAQLARRLAVRRLEHWGHPPTSDLSGTVALLIAELAANAVRHGRVPGREFHLRLEARPCLIRIEVSDASPDRPPTGPPEPSPDDESGRGLLLVDVLASRWGATPRVPIGKTVWAEVAMASRPEG
ncbi:ATP-binding protein [Streptomyces sp. NBC_01481]|uniref:ATP-binding protein n=1 Tax=Streptomyces sp. NBC_01481 TaxID=2975869 RepID=UPI00225C0636|nr:ATP-binding protein [Streptomyces sp. NBC_01481]MCX4584526.1 ATP-binding protein [Streptomyces sp. NBC_01481]